MKAVDPLNIILSVRMLAGRYLDKLGLAGTVPAAEPQMIRGDVNADGRFDVSDVVALQKWLLAVPDAKLSDWKAGDLCADGLLDIYDLCMMKRELVGTEKG